MSLKPGNDTSTFRPERFSPEETKGRPSIAHIPFGGGPRQCVGMRLAIMEYRLALVKLLKNHRFVTCEQTVVSFICWSKYFKTNFLIFNFTESVGPPGQCYNGAKERFHPYGKTLMFCYLSCCRRILFFVFSTVAPCWFKSMNKN